VNLSIILGIHPEIIKMSSPIRECEKRGLDYFILHTGQHYSYNMDKVFLEQLGLPEAKYNSDIGSGSHAEETGKMTVGRYKILVTGGKGVAGYPLVEELRRKRNL